MFLEWIETGDYLNYICNGGIYTMMSYSGLNWNPTLDEIEDTRQYIRKHFQHHIEFLKGLPYYHETDDYIFVHAGLNSFYKDWHNTPPNEMIWIRDLFIDNPTQTDKVVVFGHTPCVYLHETEDIWFGGDKIGIDGGCAYGMQLNCLEIREDGYETYFVESKVK
jgi:serine/threonine protein phosphatase 1